MGGLLVLKSNVGCEYAMELSPERAWEFLEGLEAALEAALHRQLDARQEYLRKRTLLEISADLMQFGRVLGGRTIGPNFSVGQALLCRAE